MIDWQPIASAPRDGSTFLTWTPGMADGWQRGYDLAGWLVVEECWWKGGCGFDQATHWAPLAPPNAESGRFKRAVAILDADGTARAELVDVADQEGE